MARTGLTGSRLVLAAAELADDAGLQAVTVSALARQFDVKPASIYSHVEGLDDLLEQTTELALGEIADRLAEALPGKSGRDALVALADTHRDYARAHPGRWQAAQRRVRPESVPASSGARISRATRAILSGYGLTPDDEVHAVRLIGSMVNGFIAIEVTGGFDHSEPAASESWSRSLDAIDSALLTWAAAAQNAAAALGAAALQPAP
jgi:AcrR family transcriptional regulator